MLAAIGGCESSTAMTCSGLTTIDAQGDEFVASCEPHREDPACSKAYSTVSAAPARTSPSAFPAATRNFESIEGTRRAVV
jgi:hypothetical protein